MTFGPALPGLRHDRAQTPRCLAAGGLEVATRKPTISPPLLRRLADALDHLRPPPQPAPPPRRSAPCAEAVRGRVGDVTRRVPRGRRARGVPVGALPRWTLLPGGEGDGDQRSSSPPPTLPPPRGCHVAADRGRRRSQEDRAVCALGIRIPFIERMRIKEVDVGVVAVFNGHNGAEASEMASKLLLEYFLLHVYFLLDGIYSIMFRKSTEKLTYKEVTILNNVLHLYKEDQSNHSEGLRSYMELCILVPGISSQHQGSGNSEQGHFGLASWKCSEESFAHQVKIRDPLKMGFPNLWALRLARQLLVWHPEDRLSVDEALKHPYFQERP